MNTKIIKQEMMKEFEEKGLSAWDSIGKTFKECRLMAFVEYREKTKKICPTCEKKTNVSYRCLECNNEFEII